MNCKRVSMLAAIPMSLLFAGFAFGQATPPPPATTMQPPTMQSPSAHTGNTSFDALASSKGYVTESEARRDPWLSSHFSECDSNRDGKVNRVEFNACHHDQGQPMQPQSSGR